MMLRKLKDVESCHPEFVSCDTYLCSPQLIYSGLLYVAVSTWVKKQVCFSYCFCPSTSSPWISFWRKRVKLKGNSVTALQGKVLWCSVMLLIKHKVPYSMAVLYSCLVICLEWMIFSIMHLIFNIYFDCVLYLCFKEVCYFRFHLNCLWNDKSDALRNLLCAVWN
jgi:hypothetical protein